MITRRTALLTASAAALSACATGPSASGGGDTTAFNAFLEDVFEDRLDRSPQMATSIGDKRNYDKWDDPSAEADARDLQRNGEHVAQMRRRFGSAALDPQAQLSYRLFEERHERALAGQAFSEHPYRFNQMFGAQSGIPAFMINQHQVSSVEDAEAYVERLRGVEGYLDAIVARSDAAAARGIMPPRFVYDYVLSDCRNVIAGAPMGDGEPSPLFADITSKVSALDASQAVKDRLLADAAAALVGNVQPAYERAIVALTAQQARAGTDDGAWRLPDGSAYYAERLAAQTTTSMTADEIHELGLAEVARIHGEMRGIMQQVGFAGDLPAFWRFMREDPRFYLPDTPEGRAEYIARAEAAVAAITAATDNYFNLRPRAPMIVRAVEPFRERSAGLAFYQRPSADGSRPGVYYANTHDMRALPLYQLEALAYHEGVPGHHFQIAIQQELTGLPRLRRFGGYTAYSEGWGLYCEFLAKEMGFYQDPYSDFGRLTMENHRAIRLVVDTGLHHKRWTRQQAIDYTLANQPVDPAQARRDIDRYIVMPGQATAYKIGMNEILRLRNGARARLGDRFDIKGFHDVVLAGGAVPLTVLGERVAAWQGV